MAIVQDFLSMDAFFALTDNDKIIINDLSYFDVSDIELVNKSLMTIYDTDVLSTVPRCECGELSAGYYLGMTCDSCGTVVKEANSRTQPLLWLKSLDSSIKFLNPAFWLTFKKMLHKNLDLVRWMSDAKYNPPVTIPPYMYGIRDILDGKRTYSNMLNHMEEIILYLIDHPKFKDVKKQQDLKDLLTIYRSDNHLIFSDYLPIINKKLFVVEKTTKGKFTNLVVSDVINVVMLWLKIGSSDNTSLAKMETATVSALSILSDLLMNYLKTMIIDKHGLLRKHVFGARINFTFRTVIVSISGPHEYDEIHIPWAVGVTVFRPYILNLLVNRYGYSVKKAKRDIVKAINIYDPVIDTILQTLINESPDGRGIPILTHRNPTLLQGSSLFTRITKVKTDVEDKTTAVSSLIIKYPNGDYDGDELNFFILGDEFMARKFSTLKPHYNIPDTSKPYSISGNLSLLAPANSIMTNWLLDKEDDPEKDTVYKELETVEVELPV